MSNDKQQRGDDQTVAAAAALMQNIDWSSFSKDQLQELILQAKAAGKCQTAALHAFLEKAPQTPVQAKLGFDGNVKLVQTVKQEKGGVVTLQEMLDDAARFGSLKGAYDYYREDESRIPDEWKGKVIFFPETEFLDGGHRYVRYLLVDGFGCAWNYRWVSDPVSSNYFVAVPA